MRDIVNEGQSLAEYLPSQQNAMALGPMDAYTPLSYMGGPLLKTVELVSLYWGSFASADIDTMQAWLQGFAGYLSGVGAPLRQDPVLAQYGILTGSVGTWHQESTAPANATEADVQSLITRLQGAGTLPGFSDERLFLVFTLGVTFAGYGTQWCAYHGSWGPGQYFAINPYPSAGGCGSGAPVQSWQSVTSHEILEACTDASPGSGWVEGGQEGGDVCAWQEVTMPFGTVQRFADNLQMACSVYTTKVASAASIGRNADGRLEAFAIGTDSALWHIWQTSAGGGWSGWSSLGGRLTSEPVVIANGDGRLEVFALGTDRAVWHIWQTAPNNGWSGWGSLGGVLTSELAAANNQDGRIEIFSVGTDGALWHIWQTAPNNGWSGWGSLGGVLSSDPVAARNADGRVEIFARGTDDALWHIWQTGPNNGWSGWDSLGGVITSDPAVANNADGRLEVVARGTDGAVWHIWQTAPNNGWSGWASLSGVIAGDPAVGLGPTGALDVFARGSDDALWHIFQTAPNNGWSEWSSLHGGLTSDPAVGKNADGRLEVFIRGTDQALWHIWQITLPFGIVLWSGWASFGGAVLTLMHPEIGLIGHAAAIVQPAAEPVPPDVAAAKPKSGFKATAADT